MPERKELTDAHFANRIEDVAAELSPQLTRPIRRQIDFLRKRVSELTKDDGSSKLQEVVFGLADDIMKARSGGIKDVPRAIAGAIVHSPDVLTGLDPAQIRFMLNSSLAMIAEHEDKSRKTSEKGALLGNPKLKDEYERWVQIHTERAESWRAIQARLRQPASIVSPAQRA